MLLSFTCHLPQARLTCLFLGKLSQRTWSSRPPCKENPSGHSGDLIGLFALRAHLCQGKEQQHQQTLKVITF